MVGQDFDKMTDFDMMVVDVTLGAEDAVAKLGELTGYLGVQDTGVVLTIPGGSSAKMIDSPCASLKTAANYRADKIG